MIGGMTMIERVFRQASKVLDEVWMATDDDRIHDTVSGFGGRVIMTSSSHRSGTDRCAEAAVKITGGSDDASTVIINIQGDEPFIRPEQIKALMECFIDTSVRIATLIRRVMTGEDLFNPAQPKVIVSKKYGCYLFQPVSDTILP